LTLCNKNQLSVVPHGGLTGLSEGALTKTNEIVISTEHMANIEEIDPIGRTLTAQSGAKLQSIQEAAEAEGMYFPLDLGARGSCTIGGNASTNAGGNKVIRYGMTRDLILGLEAVLADGTIISSMNSMIKNNTGYDLKQLFIGSEGTLGIITRVVLRLQEKPLSQCTALLAADSFDKVKILDNSWVLFGLIIAWAFIGSSIQIPAFLSETSFPKRIPESPVICLTALTILSSSISLLFFLESNQA